MRWIRLTTIFIAALFIGYRAYTFFSHTEEPKATVAPAIKAGSNYFVAEIMANDEALGIGKDQMLAVVRGLFSNKGPLMSVLPPCGEGADHSAQLDWASATLEVITVRRESQTPEWLLKVELPSACASRMVQFTLPLQHNSSLDSLFVVPDPNLVASSFTAQPAKEELANKQQGSSF